MFIAALVPVIGPAFVTSYADLTPAHSHVFTASSQVNADHHPCADNDAEITCVGSEDASGGTTYSIATPESVSIASLQILWLSSRSHVQERPNEWIPGLPTPPPRMSI